MRESSIQQICKGNECFKDLNDAYVNNLHKSWSKLYLKNAVQ